MTRVRRTFAAGCAGTFVSLSAGDRPGRVERPALHPERLDATSLPLAGLREAFADVPFPADADWPRASVIVCSHNGARTISECLAALQQLEYPDFEVIVVDDGSTDATAAIARTHGFRVIATENRGLSSARNTGLAAATGDIVAYIDDDAFPDPQWLSYLALAFLESRHAGIGGPNVPPPGAGLTADCVAHSPGSPMHMLLSEHEAEHIPGCNMAFRASALRSIGGFDPRLRVAGDDVDVCWRIRQRGWTLGFSPGALVWHRRRGTVRAYWRQQRAYGTAEALLERKWRERYNTAGHVAWAGSSKAGGAAARWGAGIYGGRQEVESVYRPALNLVAYLPLIPEWYLLIAGLAALSAMAILWKPLLLVLPLLGAAVGTSLLYAAVAGTSQPGPSAGVSMAGLRRRMLIMFLHLVQPVARLTGRLGSGLWPGRWQGPVVFFGVRPLAFAARSEHWVPIEERVRVLEETLRFLHARTVRGGPRDRWELEVRGGLFGAARVLLALEDQAAGTQVLRVRAWPRGRLRAGLLLALFSAPAAWAAWDHAWFVSAVLGAVALAIVLSTLRDCCHAMALVVCALETAHVEGA
jgi:GT2 family glycosyltransferase